MRNCPGETALRPRLRDCLLRQMCSVIEHGQAGHLPRQFPKPEDHEPAGLIIRKLQQRWGSVTTDGKLILNRLLIRSSIDAGITRSRSL